MTKEMNFVYAVHDDEYAEAIGVELANTSPAKSAVALEWASMSSDATQVDYAATLANGYLSSVVRADSIDEARSHLGALGGFYGRLMAPLVGSQVSVHLIDSYKQQDLAMRSYSFNNYEYFRVLSTVVNDDKMNLSQRRQMIIELAAKSEDITSARESLVIDQLHKIAETHDSISIFQGIAHQPVADVMKQEGYEVTKVFVPELMPWPGQDNTAELDRDSQFQKLQKAVGEGRPEHEVEDFANRALLAEYIVAYLSGDPGWRALESNPYAAMIAAARIIGTMENDRVASKVKAVVKSSIAGQPTTKAIKPLLPKHSPWVTF